MLPYKDIWAGHRLAGTETQGRHAGGRPRSKEYFGAGHAVPQPKPDHRHELVEWPSAGIWQCRTCKATGGLDSAWLAPRDE